MAVRKWMLRRLPTVHEARTEEKFNEGFVFEIPTRLAKKALSITKSMPSITQAAPVTHHYLRHLVKQDHLPTHLRDLYCIETKKAPTIFLLVPDSPTVSVSAIKNALEQHLEDEENLCGPYITRIPCVAPTTVEQAKLWSEQYWPCIYNPASQTIQEAPPLQLQRAIQIELENDRLPSFLNLAWLAAQQCEEIDIGRGIGAVVIDPATTSVVAVAGDARWWSLPAKSVREAGSVGCEGRPEYHAIMRVIAQVAQQELGRRHEEKIGSTNLNTGPTAATCTTITPVELQYGEHAESGYALSSSDPSSSKTQTTSRLGAYLCNGLDLYVTHEPCIACAMAMVHSRFRACIFEKQMPATGGFSAEIQNQSLGYGLFWRRELNWRFMVFQYLSTDESDQGCEDVSKFHA